MKSMQTISTIHFRNGAIAARTAARENAMIQIKGSKHARGERRPIGG